MATSDDDDGWREIEPEATDALFRAYPADALVTYTLAARKLSRGRDAFERRYENVRCLAADWINAARDADLASFERFTLDVWLSQRCDRGAFRPEMQLTLCGLPRLPGRKLLAHLERCPALVGRAEGVNPVALGAFPELRVAGGTVKHPWKLSTGFVGSCATLFRQLHGLDDAVRDPYTQMLSGADEPEDFPWTTRS